MRKIVKWMFIVAVTLVLADMLSGCRLTKQQRSDNRVAKKIEKIKAKHPASFKNVTTETVRIDTVLQEIYIKGETKLDTIEVEKYLTKYLHDTVEIDKFITRFIEIANDTIEVDTLAIHLWIAGVGVSYELRKDKQHIEASKEVSTLTITKTEVINKVPWWIWMIIISLILTTVLTLLKSRF